ncbi:MAG: hypothetical protein IPM29_30015 [Planctomycetes bacterium]|nr:hypothetical protein [Planctomycetota bacterium]
MAAPIAIGVTAATPAPSGGGTATVNQTYSKMAGFDRVRARSTGGGSRPDFTFAALFAGAAFEVDALSIGLDQLNVHDPCGRPGFARFPDSSWGAVMFSVAAPPPGGSGATGALGREESSIDGALADVFSHIVRGSNVPIAYRLRTDRALDSPELGLFRGGPAPQTGDIVTMDAMIPAFDLDGEILAQLPIHPSVYFSVTDATKALVPATWWSPADVSGATILRSTWDGTSWSTPNVLVSWTELGLTAINADIDALAVEESRAHLVFSLTRATTPAGWSQLMYFTRCTDFPLPVPYTAGSPTSPTEVADDSAGGSDTDIDAVCIVDPGAGIDQAGSPAITRGLGPFLWGTPRDVSAVLPWPVRMEVASFRGFDRIAGTPTWEMYATRIPANGAFAFAWPGGTPFGPPILAVASAVLPPQGGVRLQVTLPPLSATRPPILVEGVWVGLGAAGLVVSDLTRLYF